MSRLRLTLALSSALVFATHFAVAETRTDINVVAPWEISGVDPAKDGYICLRMGVMETLVDVSLHGELRPGLALDWHASDDGLEWRFKIRKAAFHDGTSLKADSPQVLCVEPPVSPDRSKRLLSTVSRQQAIS